VRTFEDPTYGTYFYNGPRGIADVHALAIAGQTEAAIKALRVAIENRYSQSWQWFAELDPNMASLHDDPRFQEMRIEIQANMAEQLNRLRDMQAQVVD
jgi:hypothetical protein